MKKIIIILLNLLVLFSCLSGQKSSNPELLKFLENEITKSKKIDNYIIDLSLIDTFEWDTIYTIPPYSNEELVLEETTIINFNTINTDITSNDGIALVVFVKNKEIVDFIEVPRRLIDLAQWNKIEKKNAKIRMNYPDYWKISNN